MMLDYIPFDIQSEIIKYLRVKSILQFRSVSKQWKCLIDSSKFITKYHFNRKNPQHHLVVGHMLGGVQTYMSIIDDITFPQQKHPLTSPESLNSLTYTYSLPSVNGLLCFLGYTIDESNNMMAVIWNPSIRKSVSIVIPDVFSNTNRYTVIGFGVSPDDTCDPKLVKINVNKINKPYTWAVEVFTLSTRVWNTAYRGAAYKSCNLRRNNVFIDGIIYWRDWDEGFRSNYIISFDLKRETFGEVSLSERLALRDTLLVTKVNESLGLLDYYKEGEIWVCGVWRRRDGVNKPFTKMYSVKVEGKSVLYRVMGFRKNGEVVLEMDDDNYIGYNVEVYEPSSGHINGVGVNSKYVLSVVSYTETLIFLNESNSIIHG